MIALIAVLLAAPTADALSGPAPVTMDALLAYAAEHAPRQRVAAARVDVARHTARGQDVWPEPRLMIGVDPLPIETRNGPAWGRASLTQPLPWGDTLAARREAADAGTRVAEEQVAVIALDVRLDAERALARLRASRDEQAVVAELLELNRMLLRSAEDKLGVDRARHADVIAARIELARLETVALDVAQQALTRQAELNAAIGRDTLAIIGPLAPPSETATASLDRLLESAAEHPTLAANAARIEAARARLRAASTGGRPQFSVGLGYTLIGTPDGSMAPAPGRDALSVQMGMTLPLWGGEAYDGAEAAAEAAIRLEESTLDAAADLIAWRIVEQTVAAETALRRLRLYRDTALPLADERLAVLTAAYAAGEVPFERVLDAEKQKERYATAAIRAAEAFAIARAALAHAVGRPLPVGSDGAAPQETP